MEGRVVLRCAVKCGRDVCMHVCVYVSMGVQHMCV